MYFSGWSRRQVEVKDAAVTDDTLGGITSGPALSATAIGLTRAVGNETYKNLLTLWAYRLTLLPELALLALTYLMLQFFIGGGKLVEALLPSTTVAFVFYVFTYYTLAKVVSGLLEEVNTGTLEQSHMSPLPSWALSLSRVGAAMVQGGLVAGVIAAGFVVALGIDLSLRWSALVSIGVTILDVAGFALLIAGLALTIASIGAVLHVIQGMVMLLNGSLLPVEAFPAWLESVARLVPGTLGIEATRAVLFDGTTLASVWTNGTLPWAILHAASMIAVGWVTYQRAIRKGLRTGRLGP
jgi:ABC-2 type transport system permease protein